MRFFKERQPRYSVWYDKDTNTNYVVVTSTGGTAWYKFNEANGKLDWCENPREKVTQIKQQLTSSGTWADVQKEAKAWSGS